jgi:hypothetical protein
VGRKLWLVTICVVALASCTRGNHPSPAVAPLSDGWRRLLPTSTRGYFVESGLNLVASGPRGSVALGAVSKCKGMGGFWSRDAETWHVVRYPPTIRGAPTKCFAVTSVVATDTGFIAVGGTRPPPMSPGDFVMADDPEFPIDGLIWTSSDGDVWELVDTGKTFVRRAPYSVASDGKLSVATVASSGADVATTTDGVHWTTIRLGADASVEAVAHGPRGWVAVGQRREGVKTYSVLWRSDDGRRWTTVDGVAGYALDRVAAGPARFVVRGYDGQRAMFLTSTDGRAWSETPAPREYVPPSPVVAGDRFLAFGVTGYVDEGPSHPKPAMWVLDGDAWARVPLPKEVFNEPNTLGQPLRFGQPRLMAATTLPDGSMIVVGGGQPTSADSSPSYGPRIWRWQPNG